MRTTTIIDISINYYNDFYNDDIPFKTSVTNLMLNDVPNISIESVSQSRHEMALYHSYFGLLSEIQILSDSIVATMMSIKHPA